MFPQAFIASSSRSAPVPDQQCQHYMSTFRPGSPELAKASTSILAMIDDLVQTIFARYQQRLSIEERQKEIFISQGV